MSKYSKASEELEKMVNDISMELGLDMYGVDFMPLYIQKSKEVCKVVKANELAEYASNREDLVFVLCYEEAFERTDNMGHALVDEKNKYMWLKTEMSKVQFDPEKEKLSIGCPTISVPLSMVEEYGDIAVKSAELGLHVIAQITEKKKEEAQRKKEEKKHKK